MNIFTAHLGILWRMLGGTPAAKPRAIVRFEVDLSVWDPSLSNQRQDPKAWLCEITEPSVDGRPATYCSAHAHDGAEAMVRATDELMKARRL